MYLAMVLISTLALAKPGGSPADTSRDSGGSDFRIPDFIPGEYASRLRRVNLRPTLGWGSGETAYETLEQYETSPIGLNLTADLTDLWHYENEHKEVTYSLLASVRRSGINRRYGSKPLDLTGYNSEDKGRQESTALNKIFSGYAQWFHYGKRHGFVELSPGLRYARSDSWSKHQLARLSRVGPVDSTLGQAYLKTDTEDHSSGIWVIFKTSLRLSVGRGRIYDGIHTWRAMDLLSRTATMEGLDPEDVEAGVYRRLAHFLYNINVRKYPPVYSDHLRLKDYETTEGVVQLLEQELGLDRLSPEAVAQIHDILRYYPNFSRRFGRRVRIGLDLDYSSTGQRTNWEYRQQSVRYYGQLPDTVGVYVRADTSRRSSREVVENSVPELFLTWEVFTPLSASWQWDVSISAYYRSALEKTRTSQRDDSVRDTTITIPWEQRSMTPGFIATSLLSYIASSRTYWTLTGTLSVEHHKWFPTRLKPDKPGELTSISTALISLRLDHSLAWQLYISSELTLSAEHTRNELELPTGTEEYSNTTGLARLAVSLEYYF